jgi:hypothetical protein
MIKTKDLSRVRSLFPVEVVDLLREDGIIIGDVVMSWSRFIKRCYLLGFDPVKIKELIF